MNKISYMLFGVVFVFWLFGGVLLFRRRVLKIQESATVRKLEKVGIWIVLFCIGMIFLVSRM
jgi:hypothetical protein